MRKPALLVLSLAYLAFFALGLPDTVLGVAWPSLRSAFGVSQAGLGAVLVAGVTGYFASGLIAGRLIQALGVGGLLTGSTGLVALGLVGYAIVPSFSLFLPLATLIGLGSGAIDTALNDYGARHVPVRHLNWLHASWGVGATLGPLVMTGVLAAGLAYPAGYLLLAGGLGAMLIAFAATRRSWADGSTQPTKASAWGTLRRGRVWLQIAIFFVYTGLESSAGQWCFTVLRETRGLGVEAAGAWTAAYWGSLLAGRVGLGFLVDRIGPDRLLRLATCTGLLGAILFSAQVTVGLVLLGTSLAPIYPTLMARTPDRLGAGSSPHAIGLQVSAATLGAGVLPGAIGLWVASAGAGVVPLAAVGIGVVLLALHEVLIAATAPHTAHIREPPTCR